MRIAPSRLLPTFSAGGNARAALTPLRDALAIARSGGRGCDIVCIGSSLTRGLNDATHFRTGWVHRLKLLMQGAYNPAGVRGGYGYMRAWDVVGGTRNDSTFMTTAGTVAQNTGGTCITRLQLSTAAARTNRMVYQFDGSLSDNVNVAARRGVTDIELLVHGGFTTDGRVDIQVGSAPGASAGTLQSATLDTTVAPISTGSPDHRVRYTGLTSTSNNFFQIGNGASAPAFFTAGVIAYNGDWATGVRVHNLGFPGGTASNLVSADELNCAVDKWSTGAATGAQNAKLFILELGVNDYRTAISLATFQANVTTILDRIEAQPTAPGVIILIPPMTADAATWASPTAANPSGRSNLALQMNMWLYSLSGSRPNVTVVDMVHELGGNYRYDSATVNGYNAALDPRGWAQADKIHWDGTDAATGMQVYVSNGLFNLIQTTVGL